MLDLSDDVIQAFAEIPVAGVLAIADRISCLITLDPTLVVQKANDELVTQADIEIQRLILDHFANSPLAGQYNIKSEEPLIEEEKALNSTSKLWQLIVDPLDGTNSFCKGESMWGTMVGLCNREGEICFSWNMISTGEVFSSAQASSSATPRSWNESLGAGDPKQTELVIDVFDYGAGAAESFPASFQEASGGRFLPEQVRLTAYPSAVFTAWQLFNGALDGLLWLSSEKGKGNFPDYDLIMLGVLAEQGWKIALGKSGDSIEMVAVAASQEDLDVLWTVGEELVPARQYANIERDMGLGITSRFTTRSGIV